MYYLYSSLFHKTSTIPVGGGSGDNIIGGGGAVNDYSNISIHIRIRSQDYLK